MWDRWQKGDSLHEIARLFDRHHTSVRSVLVGTGGIRPPERRRAKLAAEPGGTGGDFPPSGYWRLHPLDSGFAE